MEHRMRASQHLERALIGELLHVSRTWSRELKRSELNSLMFIVCVHLFYHENQPLQPQRHMDHTNNPFRLQWHLKPALLASDRGLWKSGTLMNFAVSLQSDLPVEGKEIETAFETGTLQNFRVFAGQDPGEPLPHPQDHHGLTGSSWHQNRVLYLSMASYHLFSWLFITIATTFRLGRPRVLATVGCTVSCRWCFKDLSFGSETEKRWCSSQARPMVCSPVSRLRHFRTRWKKRTHLGPSIGSNVWNQPVWCDLPVSILCVILPTGTEGASQFEHILALSFGQYFDVVAFYLDSATEYCFTSSPDSISSSLLL